LTDGSTALLALWEVCETSVFHLQFRDTAAVAAAYFLPLGDSVPNA
jgi:hypothetical protein